MRFWRRHEGTWFALEKRIQGLKNKFQLPDGSELHARDFCCSYNKQDKTNNFGQLSWPDRRLAMEAYWQSRIASASDPRQARARRRKYQTRKHFFHLSRAERSGLFEEILDHIGNHRGISLFGEVADVDRIPDHTGHSFTQVVTRFDAFLKRFNANSPPGQIDNGIVLMDRETSKERQLHEMLVAYREQGHPWGQLKHVLEMPFFVDSHTVLSVQLADIVAYAIRRYVEHNPQPGSPEENNFRRIYHLFDRDGHKLHGLRHYCEPNSCICLICRDRGHSDLPSRETS
ncbi:MAG: DUF3800 domain-containing protein [Magnetococcales bacterium]|nr:DUF3800 domain-containing protein [Magnetococcales bacterium]